MKKKLWVTRDYMGYSVWDKRPSKAYHGGSLFYFGSIYNKHEDMDIYELKKALHGCDVKLEMNQMKRIELTIKAEVKEL
jgi:hypothetical protein